MNNQELAPVEEKIEVEEAPKPVASEASPDLTETQITPEPSPPDEPAATGPEETAPATSSEESGPLTESEAAESQSPSIHTLKIGQHIAGTVKNITGFGAFVDIGIPQDGLVHISKLSRRKVDKVTDVVSAGQEVDVWVKKVDKKRGRISLTMVKPIKLKLKSIKEEAELKGTITRLEPYGAFVDIGSDRDGLVHISQVTHDYIKHPEEALTIGDQVKVKVLKVNRKKRQVDLSIKSLLPPPQPTVAEVKRVKKVKPVPVVAKEVEDESAPTAMSVAYAAFQNWSDPDEQAATKELNLGKGKGKKKREMDAIVSRTLATREKEQPRGK